MPARPARHLASGALVSRESRLAYDKRRDEQLWRRWYKTARWQARRAEQLAHHPLCAACEAVGLVVPATVADHVERHQGDHRRFWEGKLQSLCASCHSSDKQRAEKGNPKQRLDADGWPIRKQISRAEIDHDAIGHL